MCSYSEPLIHSSELIPKVVISEFSSTGTKNLNT